MVWHGEGRRAVVESLATSLVSIRAVQFGTFTLASGKRSSYYVDLRTVPSFPEAYHSVIDAYLEVIKNGVGLSRFDAIAGIPTAGLAFSSPVAHALQKPMIYARKEEKQYGRQKRIEGVVQPGWRVLVIDDLITTGGSILSAISAIREEGVKVEDALVLIDRLEGGRDNLAKEGVRLHTLTDILEMSDILYSRRLISETEMEAIAAQVGRKE